MKRAIATSSLVVALLLLTTACRSSTDLSLPETQRQFGVRMAKMNLWREAMFRFQRAVEIEPQNAMAHNNLAVAYEAVGDFEAAALAYREAMRLDRSNQYIQKNYSRYVEFTQRSKRREATSQPSRAAAGGAAAASESAPQTAEPAAAEPLPAPATKPATEPLPDPTPVVEPGPEPVPESTPPPPPAASIQGGDH
ncbi:MAG TPA: tetratricopeptide repeat protein [Thermoanaerobaculia bacterium]